MIGFNEVAKNLFDPMFTRESDRMYDPSLHGRFESGHVSVGRRQFTNKEAARLYQRDLKEAMGLFKRALDGDELAGFMMKRAMRGQFREALSISDFGSLFGDIIDRSVLANYRETTYTWSTWAHLEQVNDFRVNRRIRVDYGTGIGTLQAVNASNASLFTPNQANPNSQQLTPVELMGQYPEDKLADSSYLYNLMKFGRRMPFAWETMVNDDLNALKDTPARFGIAMRRMEEYFNTAQIANNTNFFKKSNNNIVDSGIPNLSSGVPVAFHHPQFSIAALQQAMLVFSMQRDLTGQPISVEALVLMVPPALEIFAQNVMNATQLGLNEQGGTLTAAGSGATATNYNAERLYTLNWMKGRVKLVVNYQLPLADPTYGNQAWYLFSDPNYRPAVVFGKLRGHADPDLFMKLPNSVAIGEGVMGPGGTGFPGTMGGAALGNPMEGDFETDAIHYKIRHVFGGTTVDPVMAVFSNASGIPA